MARIPDAFIDELLGRTDIVSLVQARVPLKKAGKDYQARCPFHDENTPSFTVSPSKQFYHCFGCGAHGTAISFVMEYDRLPFREAIESLAEQAGMALPDDYRAGGADIDQYKPLYEALAAADRIFRSALRRNSTAVEYLKSRGISGEIAQAYGIGYAPAAWDTLRQQLPRKAAVTAGLLVERDDGHTYDRLRDRITFPIRDTRGRTVGFGGRILPGDGGTDDKTQAKYLNSPETPLFHKGRNLYGLFEARQALRDIQRLIVVEGYMDVVALAQHGFHNAVATLGTATTGEHLQVLFRVCDQVIFCFDGDSAGRRAGWRALEQALPQMRGTRRASFLFLPDGEDPDSLVRSADGRERFTRMLDESLPASTVLLDGLREQVDTRTADGRSQLVEMARAYVRQLPPEAFKAQLIHELSGLSGLPAADLERLYAEGGPPPSTRDTAQRPQRAETDGVRISPVRRALQLLMNNPALADNVDDPALLRASDTAGTRLLAEAIDFFQSNPNYTVAMLLGRWREHEHVDSLSRLAAQTPRGDDTNLAAEFDACVARLVEAPRAASNRARFDALLARQQNGPLDAAEQAELQQLLQALRGERA